ncbi:MAG: SRPBCC domain-containing protein [Acidimicrobiia bacterium]|nr:SRPBCC domain-containing protein [Acidimicrobiia bacterium]
MATEPYRTSIEITASPAAVYPFLTQPESMLRWMGDYAVFDAQPGGEFTLDVNGVPVRGHYLELDPPHRLVFSWGHAGSDLLPPGSSTVEITLEPTGDGTRLHVEHRDLPPQEAEMHAIGWPHFLARLAIAATGQHPGPDPFATTPPPRPTNTE